MSDINERLGVWAPLLLADPSPIFRSFVLTELLAMEGEQLQKG